MLNTSPTGSEASIWQSGQGPAADDEGNVYVVTGNGSWDGVNNFSESFLKLTPQLKLLDWFTPTNHVALDKSDADLDSSGATLIPGTPLVLGGGKEGVLYTLDSRDLGHLGDEHAIQHFRATVSHLHSLVYRRLIRWAVGNRSAKMLTRRNSMTAPYLWLLCMFSVVPAVVFWDNSAVLGVFIVLFATTYVFLYGRIVRFKAPSWMILRR